MIYMHKAAWTDDYEGFKKEEQKLLKIINKSQVMMNRSEIAGIPDSWTIFYEEEHGIIFGYVILYEYLRLPCEPDYYTGRIAEITMFTFPEYRKQGVAHKLVEEAVKHAEFLKMDIVADAYPEGFAVLKGAGFEESTEYRAWRQCSNK